MRDVGKEPDGDAWIRAKSLLATGHSLEDAARDA
jgi:hypothetical protein